MVLVVFPQIFKSYCFAIVACHIICNAALLELIQARRNNVLWPAISLTNIRGMICLNISEVSSYMIANQNNNHFIFKSIVYMTMCYMSI